MRQHEQGGLFLHEHPKCASSWLEEEVMEAQNMPGVRTVQSPMCRFEMEA